MSWEDDIYMDGRHHVGESLRGMQDTRVGSFSEIGAAAQLAHLRGALGQVANARFAGHAPVSKQMRSPYKDSTQIGIRITTGDINATVANNAWLSSSLPQFSGTTRVYKSFKPTKAILTELVIAKFTSQAAGPQTRSIAVDAASDLVLVSAFSGADNCFPTAPNESTGISGPAFANNSLGNGISWPTINGGIDMVVTFAVEQTVQYVINAGQLGLPPDALLQTVNLTIRFNLLGPSLR